MKLLLAMGVAMLLLSQAACQTHPKPDEETILSTPFGNLTRKKQSPPPVNRIDQRQTRDRVESIDLDAMKRRAAALENCLARGITPRCICFEMFDFPPDVTCINISENPSSEPTVVVAEPTDATAVGDLTPTRDWKQQTKEWEACIPTLQKNHIGCGHNCVANGDCGIYMNRVLSQSEMDNLFELDWRKASDRAYANLGTRSPPVVSACFRYGCNGYDMDSLLVEMRMGDNRDRITAEAIR